MRIAMSILVACCMSGCIAEGSSEDEPVTQAKISRTEIDPLHDQSMLKGAATATQAGIGTITNVNSGKCLAIPGGNTANGTKIIQWNCNGGWEQSWAIADVIDTGIYTQVVSRLDPTKCLAVPGSSKTAGTQLIIWSCSSNPDQYWKIGRVSQGYRFTNLNSGMVMAVSGGRLDPGAPVIQWPWSGHPSQMWR